MEFTELLKKARAKRGSLPFTGCLLSLDPGETTGWAKFNNGELQVCGQFGPGSVRSTFLTLGGLLNEIAPDLVVCEAYRIYEWKRDQHSWSDLFTVRLIGAIEFLCAYNDIPVVFQMASTGKGFCTDKKLKEWGYYYKGLRHARDAIRHGCYWLLFGKEEDLELK